MSDITVTDLTIAARDGYQLAATLYRPARITGPAVLVNSATGVPRRYYGAFARHLAGQGLAVLAYDYRGIGDSLREPIRRFNGSFNDWGEKDMPAALDFLDQSAPAAPLAVVGHSAGGQILGLADNAHRGNKLYLEFGGKLLFDYHASRVLTGFHPNVKMELLQKLKERADIVLCIYAGDIERKKVRADFGITYDSDALKLIDDLKDWGLDIPAVVITL